MARRCAVQELKDQGCPGVRSGRATVDTDVAYGYEADGKLSTVFYPGASTPYAYTFDLMDRAIKMTGVSAVYTNTIDHVKPHSGYPKTAPKGMKKGAKGAMMVLPLAIADSERCRSAFRTDVDHDSEVMPISVPNRSRSLLRL